MIETPILQARGLNKQVVSGEDVLVILNDINLSVQAGESIAILGVSGSGKSTLLGLLAGLDTITHGEILLFGQTLSQLSEDGRAQLRAGQVGFIFQSFHLISSLTAFENILVPIELSHPKHAETTANLWLERVGLAKRGHHYPHQLSGGEQQRVAIARAFAINPKILFADEPTGNLDRKNSQHITELLQTINTEQKTTLVLVTHDETLAGICQHRYQLIAGRLHALS